MKGTGTHTIGRRKTSVARAFVRAGAGNIVVNGMPYEAYFGRKTSQLVVRQPLELVEALEKFDIKLVVSGGGKSGQAGAARLAIARALVEINGELRKPLKGEGFLSRDSRAVERKKYGRHKARKRPQYSKR
ncbi:MAG: 30S ribosomal protein S9 [Deltaproteobacteria bacterium]|nr:30S ribosomal protein S9 [Deltaproteobacteria bacterium]